jgi:hypothetical protein
MYERLAHRVGRSSQATPAAVDKSQRLEHENSDSPVSRVGRRLRAASGQGILRINDFDLLAVPDLPMPHEYSTVHWFRESEFPKQSNRATRHSHLEATWVDGDRRASESVGKRIDAPPSPIGSLSMYLPVLALYSRFQF